VDSCVLVLGAAWTYCMAQHSCFLNTLIRWLLLLVYFHFDNTRKNWQRNDLMDQFLQHVNFLICRLCFWCASSIDEAYELTETCPICDNNCNSIESLQVLDSTISEIRQHLKNHWGFLLSLELNLLIISHVANIYGTRVLLVSDIDFQLLAAEEYLHQWSRTNEDITNIMNISLTPSYASRR
jgi:hypothetical protein